MKIGLTLGITGLRRPSTTEQPLRFVSANSYGSYAKFSMAVASATAVQSLARSYFVVGSGAVSEIVLSFYAWFLQPSSGVNSLGNGYTIEECAIEYNGTFKPVTFGGLRTKAIANGDTDIQSDPLLPSEFALSEFAQGTTGYIRLRLSYTAGSTDSYLESDGNIVGGNTKIKYDPTKVNVTNGVDSTGAITYSMINGGVNGTDAIFITGFMPAVLGRFVSGDPATWVMAGDSKTRGSSDTTTAQGLRGISRAMFPDPALAAGAPANWNMGSPSSIGTDWASGTPAKLTAYLQYAKYGFENYGTNAQNSAASQAIHAQMRAAGIEHILRTSLTPRTTSTGAAYCPIPISSLTSVTTTATATVASTTNLTTGHAYVISGASPAAYNGTYTIGNLTATTFDYTFAGGTSPATGTIRADDRFKTEAFQVATTGWSAGGAVDTFEGAMEALVAADLTYFDSSGVRGTTHWKWVANNTVNYATSDGLHQNAVGYELTVGADGSIVRQSGTTVGTMRSIVAGLT